MGVVEGSTDRLQGRQSGFEFNGAGSPVLLFVYFCLLSSPWFLNGGNLKPDVLVSILPVLCVTNLFIYKLGTTFRVVLLLPPLLCSPARGRHYCWWQDTSLHTQTECVLTT